MNVSVNTIVSRFAFPIPSIYENDEDEHAALRGATGPMSASGHHFGVPHAVSRSSTDAGIDGSYAYVSSASSSSYNPPSQADQTLDLPRLVSSLWNAELIRSLTTGVPMACVLRPPPFIFENRAYPSTSVYVLPSGVVRLVSYGGIAATRYIAGRVRCALREAYLPAAVRRAAREERRLLQAVFQMTTTEGEEAQEASMRDGRVSLAAAIAGDAVDSFRRPRQSSGDAGDVTASHPQPSVLPGQRRRRVETADDAADEFAENSAVLNEALKVDFLQAVATPRWREIAGLREAFFASESDRGLEAANASALADLADSEASSITDVALEQLASVAAPNSDTQMSSKGACMNFSSTDQRTQRKTFPPERENFLPVAKPVAVKKAKVNVRGDAALTWWLWYLSADSVSEGKSDDQLSAGGTASKKRSSEKATPSVSVKGNHAARQFWSCAGHSKEPPTSTSAQRFREYLQGKRLLVAHHVASFKIRRNASQFNLHLLLEWNSAPPPPSLSRVSAASVSQLSLGVPRAPLVLPDTRTHPTNSSAPPREEESVEAMLKDGADAQAPNLSTQNESDQWVTEASAADFFLDSTFIAESTLPYGLESVRSTPGLGGGPSTADLFRGASQSAHLPSAAHNAQATMMPASSLSASFNVTGNSTYAAPKAAPVTYVEVPKRITRLAQRKAAPVVTEHVTCRLYRTGRMQLSAGSEVAMHQVCDALLIPFLVATADLKL